MIGLRNCAFAVVTLLLTAVGCSPLQQAPLVYASKVSVGVDVSATTTEQPGLSINLGYKQIDAAYVPVAVAKACDKCDAIDDTKQKLECKSVCTNDVYKLMLISGQNNAGDSEVPNNSLKEAKRRVDDYKKLLQARDDAAIAVTKAKEVVENANKQHANAEAISADFKKRYPQQTIDNLNLDIEELKKGIEEALKRESHPPTETELSDLKNLKSQREKAEQNLIAITKVEQDLNKAIMAKTNAELDFKKAEDKKGKAEQDFKNADISTLLSDLNLIGSSNIKTDAYSVFGSFDANTKAGAEAVNKKAEADLVIGKVFSTGVASQNLTEGMKAYYKGKGAAHCLSISEKRISDYKLTLTLPDDNQKLRTFIEDVTKECVVKTESEKK